MLDTLKGMWARFEVRYHAIAMAFVGAMPELLDRLGIIDLHPILEPFMSHEKAEAVIGMLPFILLFAKPVFGMTPHPEDNE